MSGDNQKQYTWSPKSWHAKLNRYIYGKNYLDGVDCLCPYFWGTILAGILLPFFMIGKGIAFVIDHIPAVNIDLPTIDMSYKTRNRIGSVVLYGLLGILVSVLIFGLYLAIIKLGLIVVLIVIGSVAGVIAGIIGLIFLGYWIRDKYEDWRYDHPKEDKPNLLIEFIKAKKNKHCPLVKWE